MAATVDEFVSAYDGDAREWLDTFVTFMRQNFPETEEVISYQIPTWKFPGKKMYIAVSPAKAHCTFHTLDFEMIEELKGLLPRAQFGKGSAKVPYTERQSIPILFDMARKIQARHKANQ